MRRQAQSGYALLIAMVVLLATATLVTSKLAASTFRIGAITQSETIRAQRLAREAKWALIGYAASTENKPGHLPCPDINGDGKSFALGSKCRFSPLTTNRITGCLPWRTLGLESGTDESGARVLYALSTPWRSPVATGDRTPNNESSGNDARPINPGNYGSIDLHFDSASANTTVAAIISPGQALPGQDRSAVSDAALCSGTFGAHLESGSDYFGAVINNALNDGNAALLSARSSNSFNDRIVSISREEMFRPLLIPILKLFAYRISTGGVTTTVGLPYYFSQPIASLPSSLMTSISPDPATEPQKAANIMDRFGNHNTFDLALIAAHKDQATATKGSTTIVSIDTAANNYCATESENTPADWLCYNNWYHYLAFSATAQSYTLSLTSDRTKLARTCTLSSSFPYATESLTCTN